jgi:hypothetical protein
MSDAIVVVGWVYSKDSNQVTIKDMSRKMVAEFSTDQNYVVGDLIEVVCPPQQAQSQMMDSTLISRYGGGVDESWSFIKMGEPQNRKVG